MELINHLKWRYATKKYSTEKVSEEKINQILEAINLTASSCGIQPYRVLVVSNPEIRAKLGAGSFNGQIVNSSHLLVFAAFNEISTTYIEEYIKMAEKQRNLPEGGMANFTEKLVNYFSANTAEANAVWASKQAYIGLGTALLAAAELKIDSTPMEGFDAAQFDEVLGLKEKGLHTAVILSLGYRDAENDYLVDMPKVRLPIEEFSAFVA
ncbi:MULTISPECIES: nitroreductase family protein [Olivibacter]|uniref:Nitroreductase family protein n=1 Tax=Olivibacter oleidegradans TaxID=760123 RepID=A0ABV6HMP0_9SPHI|nr:MULTISPECIES: nitroreductase family protein [Olivibacter]MDM8173113.1 nitroreductase family protein [Olivibacter sp. 47]MDX3915464.1 nitroreductase family protein [Pseudosphingobacterium sp.]QEL02895.1 NAD(P)H-dependent oxidoreductase [Olivibacter sp. LS-1]